MTTALLTDLYEISMAASYLRHGMSELATFSLFVRHMPPNRGFLVVAGLEDCLSYLERFRFEPDDLAYVHQALDLEPATLQKLGELRFDGEVWAMPEGTVAFADEPLLEVIAPIAQAQLVETYLLNQVTFQTTIATKAARCVIAAAGKGVVDFSFRRTQGIEAGIAVARASAIAGFDSTSNVEAARRFGLACSGTMAHSYVEAFKSEADAFRTFAADFPGRSTFLVDSYDTLSGVKNAIRVIKELNLDRAGVRLDSGDLVQLSRQARRLLNDGDLHDARIFASGGLDEFEIAAMVGAGAPIDAFGVGTKIGVSADAPYLDSAYKLVEYGGRPVLKLSPEKSTLPGAKQVFRNPENFDDIIGLRDEPAPAGYDALVAPVMLRGKRVGPSQDIKVLQERCAAQLRRLPDAAKRLRDPQPVRARQSSALAALAKRVREEVKKGSG